MITPLSINRIREANFVPAATVAVPIEWFKPFGIEFSRDEDDLDAFQFAGITTSGFIAGLLHYENSPSSETTILFPDGAPVKQMITAFAKEFDLPMASFRWRPWSPACAGMTR